MHQKFSIANIFRLADMIELSEFYCHITLLIVSKFKVFDVTSYCQCAHQMQPPARWVRFSHPSLHLCQPAGTMAAWLTHVRNPLVTVVLIWGLSPCRDKMQRVDVVSVSAAGIVPVYRRGDWRGLPKSLQKHRCMHSDLLERPVKHVRRIDHSSGPTRCKIHEMQAVWWLNPV